MSKLYFLMTTLWMNYSLMSPGEQFMAVFNLSIDLSIAVLLVAAIYGGATENPYAFAFWVPALGALLFFCTKQAKRRWKL
jgi:hypothetical protein